MSNKITKHLVVSAMLASWVFSPVAAQDVSSWTDLKNAVENGGTADLTSSVTVDGSTITEYQDGAIINGGGNSILGNDFQVLNNAAVSSGTITISNTTISGAYGDSYQGGAIYNSNGNTVIIGDDVKFVGNNAGSYYGGSSILNVGGNVEIKDNVSFEDNFVANLDGGFGGGGNAGTVTNMGTGTVNIGENVSFTGNGYTDVSKSTVGSYTGGAIYNDANVSIGDGATFSGNAATAGGGAIYNGGGYDSNGSVAANLSIGNNATFENNVSGQEGGAIYNQRFNESQTNVVSIGENATFSGNRAELGAGGAIASYSSTLEIGAGSKFTNNSSGAAGGAIYSDAYGFDASESIVNIQAGTKFEGNSAVNGGAIYNGAGTLTLDTSEVTLADGSVVSDIIFTGNTAADSGADLFQGQDASTIIKGDTGIVSMDGGIAGQGSILKQGENTFKISGDSSKYEGTYTQTSGTTIIDGIFTNGESVFESGSIELTSNAQLLQDASITGDVNIKLGGNSATGIDWSGNTISVGSANLLIGDNVSDLGLTLSGAVLDSENIILGADSKYSSLTLEDNSSLTNSKVTSNGGYIVIDETSSQEILGESVFKNSDVAIENNGSLTLDSSDGNIQFTNNTSADIEQGATGTTIITGSANTVTFEKGLSGEGSVTNDGANSVIFANNSDSSSFTGSYIQNDGKTTVNGTFITGDTTLGGGEFILNGTILGDVNVTGDSDITISKAVESIINDGTNGSISLVGQTGGFNIGSQKIDLTLVSAENKDTVLENIGGSANIQDLTFNGGAGLSADVDTFTVDGTVLTFGSNTANHDTNTIELQNGASLNLGNSNSGNIDLNASVTGLTGNTINKNDNTGVDIYGDQSGFTGEFVQTAGTTTLKEDSYFFGGQNTVKAGDLVIENGSHLTSGSTNSVTRLEDNLDAPYGTLVLKNDNESEFTSIDWQTGNVTLTDTADSTISNVITVDKAGLHLANGWVQEADYNDGFTLFEGGTGIRELELSNGSGVLGNITANDNSILTYNDGAFVDDKGTIKMADNVSVNLNYENDTSFGATITGNSTGTLSNINKNGAGAVTMDKNIGTAAEGQFVNTNININGGSLSANEVAINGDVNLADGTALSIAKTLAAENVTGSNAALSVLDNVTLNGNVNLSNNSNVSMMGQNNTIGGDLVLDNSNISAPHKVSVSNDLHINNTQIVLSGGTVSPLQVGGTANISGTNTISFDADGRDYSSDGIVANTVNIDSAGATIELGDINFVASPRDYNFNLQAVKANSYQGGELTIVTHDKIIDTPVGKYILLGGSNGSFSGSLVSINPQAYRGQAATVASYSNQLVVNNMLFNHMQLISHQMVEGEKTANKYAAIDAQFAPYQYSAKEGGLWYKSYGNFETISMTRGLNVHNNAYGSLIGADFPVRELGSGWKLIPTAYVAYNGAHQTFNGVGMYQNGGQIGVMGTAYKDDFITSLLAYGGGYYNTMNVAGYNDRTGNWFAGVASKSAYNFHLPADFIIQPTFLVSYNIFGEQNWHSNYGILGMNAGMLNGINVAPGTNIIWNKETFSLYATAQLVFNIMGDVKGQVGNIYLPSVEYRHCAYFEYGLGATKRIKDRLNSYLQFTIRNGTRTGIGFQGGLQWKI